MTVKDNGFPAFPHEVGSPGRCNGMLIRDWFAGQALGSLPLRTWGDPPPADIIDQWAKAAYLLADAMLEERNK